MSKHRNTQNGEENQENSNGSGHNAKARAAIIREACREIVELEESRAKISAEISEIKTKKIKGDLDMKIADFNAALRIYKLEQDDRDVFLDVLRETFEALGIGQQMDWLNPVHNGEGGEARA